MEPLQNDPEVNDRLSDNLIARQGDDQVLAVFADSDVDWIYKRTVAGFIDLRIHDFFLSSRLLFFGA